MNLNFLGRHGVKLALAATIVGSLTFASCEKETFDVNGPNGGQTIIVPGENTNNLIQQILDFIKGEQYDKLQALLDAISDNNQTLKDELKKVVDQLKENKDSNEAKFGELSDKLTQVIDAINALDDKIYNKFQDALDAINNKNAQNTQETINKLTEVINALKTASDENAQNIINGLKSDYTTILADLKKAIEDNAYNDEALKTKLDGVLEAIKNKKEFTKDDLSDVMAKLGEILEAVKENKQAVESLKELITNNTTKVGDIEALLTQMITSTPEALQNIITEINKNNNLNAEKIEAALTDIKNADKAAYEQIINAMNAFKSTVEGKLDKANEALEALKKQNEEAYKILINILQGINKVNHTEATVADPDGLDFVDKSEIAPTTSETATVADGAAFNWNAATGEYFVASTIQIPNVGAVKVLADDKAALLKAVNEDNIKTKTYNAASKKFTRAVGDIDWVQAKLLLTNKINELSLNWDATTPRMLTAKGVSKDKVTEATMKFTEKFEKRSISVYCIVNGTVYYVMGTQCVATDQGNIEPKFELKTESGEISHDFSHDYDHDHGHGNGNAGGGIGGK